MESLLLEGAGGNSLRGETSIFFTASHSLYLGLLRPCLAYRLHVKAVDNIHASIKSLALPQLLEKSEYRPYQYSLLVHTVKLHTLYNFKEY